MLQKFLPPPLLRPFVKEYWLLRLGQGSGVPLVMVSVPEQCLLAWVACVSSRQFERQFLERIGVSPKIYQRLLRFNQVMNLRKQNPALKWVDITYHCGYFDPNHLLRDFKQFTGVVPSGFDFENAVIY